MVARSLASATSQLAMSQPACVLRSCCESVVASGRPGGMRSRSDRARSCSLWCEAVSKVGCSGDQSVCDVANTDRSSGFVLRHLVVIPLRAVSSISSGRGSDRWDAVRPTALRSGVLLMADVYVDVTNAVIACAAVLTALFAGIGLNTWRKQLTGAADYDLARRLLLHAYRVRSAVDYVRAPFLDIREAGETKEGVPWEVSAYRNRWEKVTEAVADLDAASLECEVIWGQGIAQLRHQLRLHVFELLSAIEAFTQNVRVPRALSDRQRQTLYSGIGGDPYKTKLDAIVSDFDDYVRPHLKRKT